MNLICYCKFCISKICENPEMNHGLVDVRSYFKTNPSWLFHRQQLERLPRRQAEAGGKAPSAQTPQVITQQQPTLLDYAGAVISTGGGGSGGGGGRGAQDSNFLLSKWAFQWYKCRGGRRGLKCSIKLWFPISCWILWSKNSAKTP